MAVGRGGASGDEEQSHDTSFYSFVGEPPVEFAVGLLDGGPPGFQFSGLRCCHPFHRLAVLSFLFQFCYLTRFLGLFIANPTRRTGNHCQVKGPKLPDESFWGNFPTSRTLTTIRMPQVPEIAVVRSYQKVLIARGLAFIAEWCKLLV